jgi:membrane protease YdiL (CAAX protease family)
MTHVVGSIVLKAALGSAVAFPLVRLSGDDVASLGLRRTPLLKPALVGLGLGVALFVMLTGLLAGYSEELIRIFVLTRCEAALGRAGLAAALVVDSIVFGLTHRYQGMSGVVTNVVFAIVIGVFFLRRRSALEVMVAHAVNDLIAISLAFAMAPPR